MQTPLHIGVDVAKATLVIACHEHPGEPFTLSNERPAIQRWLRTVPPGSRVGVEATGRYHEPLADLAEAAGLTVFVLNPKDTRHYAQALGRRAKTDRVDAVLIARLVAKEHLHLHPYRPPSRATRQVEMLLKRQARLTVLKGAAAMTLTDCPGLAAERRALLRSFETTLARIDRELKTLMQDGAGMTEVWKRLQRIVGVGPQLGMSLTTALERVPFRNADAFVAFTGLDPRAHDSGQKLGRRRLSKRGPAELRRLLFTAAMSASRTRAWRPFYERDRAKGLSGTAALVILARRIARTAWSIHHHRTEFNPERLAPGLT
jgi:transposase